MKKVKKVKKESWKIEFNKVTWYSQLIAVVLYIGIFFWAFYLGSQYGESKGIIEITGQQQSLEKPAEKAINSVIFVCSSNKAIYAQFFKDEVKIFLSDGRSTVLPQAISASGARYANTDESFVFWNKGDTAFVQENDTTTFEDCQLAK